MWPESIPLLTSMSSDSSIFHCAWPSLPPQLPPTLQVKYNVQCLYPSGTLPLITWHHVLMNLSNRNVREEHKIPTFWFVFLYHKSIFFLKEFLISTIKHMLFSNFHKTQIKSIQIDLFKSAEHPYWNCSKVLIQFAIDRSCLNSNYIGTGLT